MADTTHKILVGIDGSKESLAAVRWAVEEGTHRGADRWKSSTSGTSCTWAT